MDEELFLEAQGYFETHPVLLKLAREFCQKYRSLSHFGGSLKLTRLDIAGERDVSAYLRREVRRGDRLTYREFSAAWERTRFGSLSLEEFLLALMPKDFTSKQEERKREKTVRQTIYERLAEICKSGSALAWLEALKSRELRLPQRDFYQREELLVAVARALDNLPQVYERLPFFANRVTGSPHGLDFDREEGRLFLQALAFLKGESVPREADGRTELLYAYHILRDDILNFATVYGLAAYDEAGREIGYWRQAAENLSPLNVPFREIVRAGKIQPLAESPVYIVENSGVFSALLDILQEKGRSIPLLALHGQLKAASWALLDKLAAGGAKFLYGGDFDPEGLSIANRLLQKYSGASLWHMTLAEYDEASQPLSEERLKKLPENLHMALQPLAEAMQRKKKILYQESLIEAMERDLLGAVRV